MIFFINGKLFYVIVWSSRTGYMWNVKVYYNYDVYANHCKNKEYQNFMMMSPDDRVDLLTAWGNHQLGPAVGKETVQFETEGKSIRQKLLNLFQLKRQK